MEKYSRREGGGVVLVMIPVFFVPEHAKTMAELSLDVKNRISHRAIASEKLLSYFPSLK